MNPWRVMIVMEMMMKMLMVLRTSIQLGLPT